ncbi:S-layer homology domain-containing protein [Paenibacillus peoriae]|uniref:S-layer homology domain-containing protein n=1 Tax=Paenibacillus peoriae TaxID=59893 RepID=UPI00026C6061|nr:S-layer homology domain-containing protein [Paenibacillus peoriae]MEC0184706.1 S-layer homology domain-containing protein [Paenibacillus peoriae]
MKKSKITSAILAALLFLVANTTQISADSNFSIAINDNVANASIGDYERVENADLSGLMLSSGTLTPAFAAGTTEYSVNVPYDVTSISVTASVYDSNATVKVNGKFVASRQASDPIILSVDSNNIITIEVTGQEGMMTKLYRVIVTRAPGSPSPQECISQETGGPLWITAACIDPQYNNPVIDGEVDLTSPVPHHKVSGHFEGTDAKFNFYLPPEEQWKGRFFQKVYPLYDENAFDSHIAFGAASGAYTVQTNASSGYRIDAAAAKFSKVYAADYYDTDDYIYGYIYGGSGGSLQTIGAIENTKGVWDGAVPFVPVVPTSIPNNAFILAYANFVLGDKDLQIKDALGPGGNGDPYSSLNDMEKAVLQEVTKLGVPLRGLDGVLSLNDLQSLLFGFGDTIKSMDSTYVEDFWNKPGYLGTEQSDLGDLFRKAKIDQLATVTQVSQGEHNVPISLSLDNAPSTLPRTGADYTLYAADGTTKIGILKGSLDPTNKVFTIGSGNPDSVLSGLETGAKLHIDNRWHLALLSYHRHQVPSGPNFYSWDQYRAADGTTIYPQRPMEIGPMIMSGVAGGGSHNGHIQGKVILISNLLDMGSFPWHSDWYSARVKNYLGESFDDHLRVWFNDNADHYDNGASTYTVVQYDGILEQALRDLSAWVEQGVAPAESTHYNVVDSQIKLPESAAERKGIQPIVDLLVNGTTKIYVKAGQRVTFQGKATVPSGYGKVVKTEWDSEGTGNYKELSSRTPAASVTESVYFTYTKPGTYYPALRVTAQRDGDKESPFTRVENLGRVRVVVEEEQKNSGNGKSSENENPLGSIQDKAGEGDSLGSIQDKAEANNGKIRVKPTINANGKATVQLNTETAKRALKQTAGDKLEIKVEAIESINEIEIEFPVDVLLSDGNTRINNFEIETGLATLNVSSKLISKSSAKAKNVKVSVTKVNPSSLSPEIQAQLSDRPVYSFNLEIDGRKVSEFDGRNDIQVTIPYELKSGEQPNKIIIYQIRDNGDFEIVMSGKFNKKTGGIAFKPKRLGKFAVAFTEVNFQDVTKEWAKEPIEALAARGVIIGTGDGKFNPDDKVTRAEFITMLMNVFELTDSNATTTFSDINIGTWCYDEVATAQRLGIIKGRPDGSFGAQDEITRQDMAIMAYQAMTYAGLTSDSETPLRFVDANSISSYALEGVTAMQTAGIISGMGNGEFAPKSKSTRAQAAVVINNILFSL